MLRSLLFLLLLLPAFAFSQVSITGHVADLTTRKPVDNASVILSNTTIGNRTAEDGSFTLKNVKPGQYDLVISIVGYETYHYTLKVSSADIALPALEIIPKSIALKEVVIKPDPNWARNFDVFKEEFLGREAKQCKILNPDVIDLRYDYEARTLSATSYDFIEIENRALGYRLKYLLTNFTKDYKSGILYYEGSVLFEDLKASKSQQKKWQKARNAAYFGSLQHFLRSTLYNDAAGQGFVTRQMIKKPNPQRLPDELIQAKMAYFRKLLPNSQAIDSIGKWAKQNQLPKTNSFLVSTPLNTFELIHRTEQPGLYSLTYNDYLYIMYTKKRDESTNNLSFRPLDVPNYATTIVTFAEKTAIFDDNGVLTNPASLIFEGDWGTSRVASMLPVDYEPSVMNVK